MSSTTQKPLYIITGATDAMGSVITQKLAEAGHAIVMACYDDEKCRAKAKELTIRTLNKDITPMHLDLGSFAQVREFVRNIKALNRPVAVLVNNAGYISHRSEKSPDGFEKLVQVNFLSTSLLSLLMYPLMIDGGRIIFSTSLSHTPVSIPYEFPAVNNFMPIAAYVQSKMALSLFSIYLSTVLRTHQVSVNSVDCGLINLSKLSMNRFFSRFSFFSTHTGNLENGARTMMRAIGSADTGFIFKSGNKQIKASSLLRNREVFIKLCNDTMRLLKTQLEDPQK